MKPSLFEVLMLLEDQAEPWKDPLATRKAALEFQSALLELDPAKLKSKYVIKAIWPWDNGRDPELTVDFGALPFKLKRDAIEGNGAHDRFGDIVLHIVIEQFVDATLALCYSPSNRPLSANDPWGGWRLYHMETDFFTKDVEFMLVHLIEYQAKFPNGERIVEEKDAPSGHTILSRFAKQLVLKGFEAEVTSKSKPGIVNRSKLGIDVKGYGMKDTLKLYKPFWAHEKGMVAFVDTKTEHRFSSVEEMVEKLKARYPKLPKCLSFVPKPEKLKESDEKLNIKQRLLQFQRDLIEGLSDEAELSDFEKVRGHAYGANGHKDTEFDRYVIVIKCEDNSKFTNSDSVIAIVIDDLDTVVVNGRKLPPSEGLVTAVVYKPRSSSTLLELPKRERYEAMIKLDYSPKNFALKNNLSGIYSIDEATSGRQEGLTQLAEWIVTY